MSTGIINVHVDMGIDKVSDQSRTARAAIVATMALKTPLYGTDTAFKDAIDKLVQSGLDLTASSAQLGKLEAELAMARATHDARVNAYDKAYGVSAASVESHSTKPEDIQSYGFAVLSKTAQPLVPPADVRVRFDAAKGLIRVRVIYPSGRHMCAVEISPNPVGPDTFVRVDGTGAIRALAGYAPGMWWIRAATLRAKEQSDWFGPVAVIVK